MAPHEIVDPQFVVMAMRDSGYKNAAYAVAELIDNAIQAGANAVELLVKEEEVQRNLNLTREIREIAVLDNGTGMSKAVLWRALQFGVGERLQDRSGIGRFGMGLPNSSISQARRFDVWSWQGGTHSAFHTYLDLDEVASGQLRTVPEPTQLPVPEVWKQAGSGFGPSGTLVVWSNVDRCQWKTAGAFFRNSEFLVGRIYRRFISSNQTTIRMAAFRSNPNNGIELDQMVRPNDPTYLTANPTLPEDYAKEPLFKPWGEGGAHEALIPVEFNNKKHHIKIRFSIASDVARADENAGLQPHGKHAKKNAGISIVRADRELELQDGWLQEDPRERWWGLEVEFPPGLDELFGVSNNKQTAVHLASLSTLETDDWAAREGYNSVQEFKEALKQAGDPRIALLELLHQIREGLRSLRVVLRAQRAKTRARRRHGGEGTAEARATDATRRRQKRGLRGASDPGEDREKAARISELAEGLVDLGASKEEAEEIAEQTVVNNRKFIFRHQSLDSASFFSLLHRVGVIVVVLNIDHPAYEHLIELMEEPPTSDEANTEVLRDRLTRCHDGMKLLIEAWARFEDELPAGDRVKAQDFRNDWGRVAREFLTS
jgi:hypothetical protein